MEVLIAVFIAGAIILVVANIPNVINLVTLSQSEAKVREATAKKIEDLRLSGYDTLANGTTAISDPKLDSLANMSGTLIISDCSSDPALCPNGEMAKKVAITITWNENTQSKSFSVTTLVAKGGLR